MIVKINRREVRAVPSDSTSGKSQWIKAGHYWHEENKYIKLLTRSHSVLSEFYYANDKSLVPWRENSAKQKLARKQKLKQMYGTICP